LSRANLKKYDILQKYLTQNKEKPRMKMNQVRIRKMPAVNVKNMAKSLINYSF
jgi:hypothetical protein